MKKKLFIIFLTVMASACFALGLSACTGSSEQGSGDGHTHNISYVAAETATCTQDGHAEYWYCADCGKYFTDAEGNNETTIAQLAISATGHEWSEWQTTKPAMCTEDGLQKRVCEKCGEEESDTVIAAGHSPADPVRENEVPATCTAEGSYDEVIYCEVCDEEISRTSKTIDKIAHSPADPVRENEVPATCSAEGRYDEVIYCEVCDEEISRTSKTIDKIAHTPADPVRENEVLATCTAEGSYDEVIYCEVCDEEISRTPQATDKLAHTYSDEWSFDNIYHWHAATCCDTGAINNKEEHILKDGICKICNAFVGTKGLEYTLSADGTYYIVSDIGTATDTEIIIPPEHNGLPVTSIGDSAFYGCDSLTSIIIPNSIKEIGNYSFDYCSSLESIYYKGNIASWCGISGLNYLLNSDRTLYINDVELSGDIVIPDSVSTIPAGAFNGCDLITSITLPDSVTKIGSSAFNGCTSIESITIPDTVTEIGVFAFYRCASLKSITIPDSVTSICESVFEGCTSLTSITIPDSIIEIGNYAFKNCTSFTNITIPDSVTSIGGWAFQGCIALESITIPDGVTSIGSSAFWNCTNITMATMPAIAIDYIPQDNLQSVVITSGDSIGDDAFSDCTSLKSLTIPDSVTSIGESAFSGCTSLESITIPDGVTSIGRSAFNDCNSLTSVTIPDSVTEIGNYAFGSCDSLESVTIPDSVTKIGISAFGSCPIIMATIPAIAIDYIPQDNLQTVVITSGDSIDYNAFNGCSSLTSITIPDSVTEIGSYAFQGCDSLINIYYNGDIASWCGVSGVNWLTDSGRTLYINGVELLDELVIPDGIASIQAGAFGGCALITSVAFPDSVTSIGDSAFWGCSSLESITIPDGVTEIGWHAFQNCTSLESVTIPDSVTSIGRSAFAGCTSLESITIPFVGDGDDYTHFGYIFGAFSYSNNSTEVPKTLKNVIITGGKSIDDYAFLLCDSLTSITIPDSVTKIGISAFGNCFALEHICYNGDISSWCSISGLNYLMESGGILYINGTELSGELVIPDNVASIPDRAFYGCDLITSVIIPASVTEIGEYAFSNCTSLESVTIPDGVTSIGNGAFWDCINITTVTMPATAIDYISKVSQDNLQTVVITSGDSIGYMAFSYCTSLKNITIPDDVTSIGFSAFYDCNLLANIYYQGDIAGWCSISGLNYLMDSGRTLYINGVELSGELVIPDGVTSIGCYAFYGCDLITSVIIPDSVTEIGEYAFSYCDSITCIIIPDSVTEISQQTFSYCTSLTYIVIPEGVISIGKQAFYHCTSLTNVTIPDGITKVDSYAFSGCTSIAVATMPAIAINYIPQDNLQTVVITSGSIGRYAFQNCSSLISVTIGNGVTSIGQQAFSNCGSLEGVYISDIAAWCDIEFYDYFSNPLLYAGNLYLNDKLVTKLVIPDGVVSIGSYAFYEYRSLISITIPDSITSIGDDAFMHCSKLVEVYNRSNLNITAGSNDYGRVAFYAKNVYTSLDMSSKLATTEDGFIVYADDENAEYFLMGYVGSGIEIALPTDINGNNYALYQCAFEDCISLTSVTIPDGVISIGSSAFSDCTSLEIIAISDSVTSIGMFAFEDCTSLKSITIPDSVISIGHSVFNSCDSLTSIVIESSNTVYHSSGNCIIETATKKLIAGCETSEIPDDGSVTSISDSAFSDCTSLTSITIPDSVTSIGNAAFSGCTSLTSITIPDSVTSIGPNAFSGCTALESLTIHDSLKFISSFAFTGCNSLEVVYYSGTESDWAEISIESYNDELIAATRYYYSETQPTEEGNFWHYAEDGVTPVIWTKETAES